MKSKTYCQLGRIGDILALLPALHHEYVLTGERPNLIVAKEFYPALEGVSYVTPVIFDGDFRDVLEAVKSVKNPKISQVVGDSVTVSQVYGRNLNVQYYADSFVKDSWRLAGFDGLWRDNLPLVIDRRDKSREKQLTLAINPSGNPYVLIFTDGHSSPFRHERLLKQMVGTWFPEHLVIKNPRGEKIHDLVGLMEKSACIFCTDSAPLHLAQAVTTPVVALAADTPTLWHGSPMRKNHLAYSRYSSFPQEIPTINDNILNLGKINDVIQVFSNYPMTGEALKRYEQSRGTWDGMMLGLSDSSLSRGTNETPFVKDMLRLACIKAESDSILILHNSDTSFYVGAKKRIIQAVKDHGSCFSFRDDYDGEPRDIPYPSSPIKYDGCDVFAFTKKWWQQNQSMMPDAVLGREAWDYMIRHVILMKGGVSVPSSIYHFRHNTHWESNPNDIGNQHNRKLAMQFISRNGIPLEHPFDKYHTDGLNR